jgi:hypothetical protein
VAGFLSDALEIDEAWHECRAPRKYPQHP